LLVKAFCTYVRPLLEYCTPVWSPYYRYLIDMVEKVQRRFTKRLLGLRHLSYPDRLQMLDLQSLERRRLSHDLILVYKILHGLTHCTLSTNLILQQLTNTRGHSYKLAESLCSHDIYKYFLLTVLLMSGTFYRMKLFLSNHCTRSNIVSCLNL